MASDDRAPATLGAYGLEEASYHKRWAHLREDVRIHAEVIVAEMERYYRDGRHPDLTPVLRAGRALLEVVGDGE